MNSNKINHPKKNSKTKTINQLSTQKKRLNKLYKIL